MIRHHYHGVQNDSLSMFAKAVIEDQAPRFTRQNQRTSGAESDKEISICLLQVRKPPSIFVLDEWRSGGHESSSQLVLGCVALCGAGAPARQPQI